VTLYWPLRALLYGSGLLEGFSMEMAARSGKYRNFCVEVLKGIFYTNNQMKFDDTSKE
jgi:hypothetical protein